jgi:hypothetical protein
LGTPVFQRKTQNPASAQPIFRPCASMHIAAPGATVDVDINLGYPATVNDPDLTSWVHPPLFFADEGVLPMACARCRT